MIQADIITTEASISTLAQCVAAIQPYCEAIIAIPIGPQPVVIDGQDAGSWDPLQNAPAIESALQTAKENCYGFKNAMAFLSVMPQVIANVTGAVGTPGILNDLSVINSVISGLTPGVKPTAAQILLVSGSLADIATQINTLQGGLSEIQGFVNAFQQSMATDVQTLTNGSQSIASAQTEISNTYAADVAQYVGTMGGGAIISILTTITDDMQDSLNAAQAAINKSVSAEGTVGPAVTAILSLFDGMFNDYTNVAKEAAKADAATFGSIIQKLDISLLQTFWQDLVTYTAANGFGVPPVQQ